MVETGAAGEVEGAVVWRPLHSPAAPLGSDFAVGEGALRRFGLMQREWDFVHYQDTEALYHRRPSAWVEPIRGFGAGTVRLVELQFTNMAPQPIDLGPLANAAGDTWDTLRRRPWLRVAAGVVVVVASAWWWRMEVGA